MAALARYACNGDVNGAASPPARIGALAQGGEILVSGTTYGTVVGLGWTSPFTARTGASACPTAGWCSRSAGEVVVAHRVRISHLMRHDGQARPRSTLGITRPLARLCCIRCSRARRWMTTAGGVFVVTTAVG